MIDLKHPNTKPHPPKGFLTMFWKNYKEAIVLEGELTSKISELTMQLDRTSGIRRGIEMFLFAEQELEALEGGKNV